MSPNKYTDLIFAVIFAVALSFYISARYEQMPKPTPAMEVITT